MKKEGDIIRRELLKSMLQLATAGFGLVAALAWNETIQLFIKEIIPVEKSGLLSQLLYAVIVTVIAVVVTYFLGRVVGKSIEKEKE